MRNTRKAVFLACFFLSGGLFAQTPPPPQNVVQLAAQGSVEVSQDVLTMVMSTSRDGGEAALVQSQLKAALDGALSEAKKSAQTGLLEVRTGNFSLHPRYGKDGKINGWQGSAELVLEGKDFVRIATAAGKIQTLALAGVSFSLSREQRTKVEADAQAMAIERFRAKAQDVAKAFGFHDYSLREVSVNAGEQGYAPRLMMKARAASFAADESAVPVEAGKTTVQVNVSGSVQLK